MVTRSSDVLLWYGFTMCMTTVWCFPDGAIGKKYILARTGDGGYALVPEKGPGTPVSHEIRYVSTQISDKPIKTIHLIPHAPLTNAATAAPPRVPPPVPINISAHDAPLPINLDYKENNESTHEENLVTLALQGRDGVNGKRGPKGPPGESGSTGRSGRPGLQGEPGTCSISQFECDVNLMKNLTARITQLEKILAKIEKPLGNQGN